MVVVPGLEVERVEQLSELLFAVALERWPQIRERLKNVRKRRRRLGRLLGLDRTERLLEHGLAVVELLNPPLGGADDGMHRVVVLLEGQYLTVDSLLKLVDV
ncbi:MAG TPA: hypothetical protein VGO31_14610 [Microbacteriaceae bacterium]|nr:hypothetical protein [Microbacteriaceae bacterium]